MHSFWRPDLSPESEPLRVTLSKGVWVDSSRREAGDGRVVPWKMYLPDLPPQAGRVPVVLWSHGLGGTRDGAGFLSRFLSTQGYVVVHIQHPGTDSSLWEGKPGHPWDVIRATRIPRRVTLQRYRDIPFVLACLRDLAANSGDPAGGLMDLSRIGMSGHSFGALTTQIMAGQRIVGGRCRYSLQQSEFRAGILYSPIHRVRHREGGQEGAAETPEDLVGAYGGISIPLLHLTGTRDDSPIEGTPYEARLAVYNHSGGPDQMLAVLEEGDHMVFAGSRGKLAASPLRDRHEEIIKILSLAFWDWHLKDDFAARDWLQGSGALDFLNGDAALSFRSTSLPSKGIS